MCDDHRAVLLAILEENEDQRLYVGERPEGTHRLCSGIASTDIRSHSGADWLVQRIDGDRVLRSEYQAEDSMIPGSPAPPQPLPEPVALSVCTGPHAYAV